MRGPSSILSIRVFLSKFTKNAKESFNGGAHHFCTTAWARLSIDISYLIGLKVHRSSNSDHPPKLRWFCHGEPSVSRFVFKRWTFHSLVGLLILFFLSPHHIKFLLVLLLHLDLRCISRTSWMAYHSMLTNHPLSIIYLPFQGWKPYETHIYCLIPL